MSTSGLTKVIIYIEIFFFIIGTLSGLISISLPIILIDHWFLDSNELDVIRKDEIRQEIGQLTLLVAAACFTCLLLWFILLVTLYRGEKEKSANKLMSWIIVNCILTSLLIFIFLTLLIRNPTSITALIPLLLYIVYRVWSLHIIHTLLNEIRFLLPQQQQQQQIYSSIGGQQQVIYSGGQQQLYGQQVQY